jgi:hypothetical protein
VIWWSRDSRHAIGATQRRQHLSTAVSTGGHTLVVMLLTLAKQDEDAAAEALLARSANRSHIAKDGTEDAARAGSHVEDVYVNLRRTILEGELKAGEPLRHESRPAP